MKKFFFYFCIICAIIALFAIIGTAGACERGNLSFSDCKVRLAIFFVLCVGNGGIAAFLHEED